MYKLEALPPDLRDLSLLARTAGSGASCELAPAVLALSPALELRPRIALSSAQVEVIVAEIELPGNTGHFTC